MSNTYSIKIISNDFNEEHLKNINDISVTLEVLKLLKLNDIIESHPENIS